MTLHITDSESSRMVQPSMTDLRNMKADMCDVPCKDQLKYQIPVTTDVSDRDWIVPFNIRGVGDSL